MTRYCSSCGKEIADGTKFCPSCGKPSEMPSPVQPQATPVQTQAQKGIIDRLFTPTQVQKQVQKGITDKLRNMGVYGFRSGKPWKMALATCVYFFLLLAVISSFSEQPNKPLTPVQTPYKIQTTPPENPADKLYISGWHEENIMSGVYNQYSIRNISLFNHYINNYGDKAVTLNIMTEIQDYTSQSSDIKTIEPHTTQIIKQSPLLKPSIEINEKITANLHYKITDTYDNKILKEETIPINLYAKETMIWGHVYNNTWVDTSYLIGAWVTPHATKIDEVIRRAAEYHPQRSMGGYQCGTNCQTDQDWAEYTSLQVKAIYDTLKNDYQITYISSTISFSSKTESSQRIKLPQDAINLASANCIDGTVLFASALESTGINPKIVMIPGHAFVCWDVNKEGKTVDCLETTMIGSSTFEAANKRGLDEYKEQSANFKDGTSKVFSIKKLRDIGVKPMS